MGGTSEGNIVVRPTLLHIISVYKSETGGHVGSSVEPCGILLLLYDLAAAYGLSGADCVHARKRTCLDAPNLSGCHDVVRVEG